MAKEKLNIKEFLNKQTTSYEVSDRSISFNTYQDASNFLKDLLEIKHTGTISKRYVDQTEHTQKLQYEISFSYYANVDRKNLDKLLKKYKSKITHISIF